MKRDGNVERSRRYKSSGVMEAIFSMDNVNRAYATRNLRAARVTNNVDDRVVWLGLA